MKCDGQSSFNTLQLSELQLLDEQATKLRKQIQQIEKQHVKLKLLQCTAHQKTETDAYQLALLQKAADNTHVFLNELRHQKNKLLAALQMLVKSRKSDLQEKKLKDCAESALVQQEIDNFSEKLKVFFLAASSLNSKKEDMSCGSREQLWMEAESLFCRFQGHHIVDALRMATVKESVLLDQEILKFRASLDHGKASYNAEHLATALTQLHAEHCALAVETAIISRRANELELEVSCSKEEAFRVAEDADGLLCSMQLAGLQKQRIIVSSLLEELRKDVEGRNFVQQRRVHLEKEVENGAGRLTWGEKRLELLLRQNCRTSQRRVEERREVEAAASRSVEALLCQRVLTEPMEDGRSRLYSSLKECVNSLSSVDLQQLRRVRFGKDPIEETAVAAYFTDLLLQEETLPLELPQGLCSDGLASCLASCCIDGADIRDFEEHVARNLAEIKNGVSEIRQKMELDQRRDAEGCASAEAVLHQAEADLECVVQREAPELSRLRSMRLEMPALNISLSQFQRR